MTSSMEPPATILMVDDNPTNLQVLFKTLQPTGRRLLAARSGEEAIETAAKTSPDLVLLDIMMPPGIDGYETIRRLHEIESLRDMPVIFLSSLDETTSKVKGFELGAVDYVPKPFQAEEVIARVNTHLTLRRLRSDLADRNRELEAANERMKTDLEAAGRVQQALLPRSTPECDGYDFGWACRPCHELGGDALDIFRIDDQTIGFYLLDVSGHGVPSSLLAITATRSLAPRSDRSSIVIEPGWDPGAFRPVAPGEVLRRLNVMNPMHGERNPHFITMIYGVLDCRTGVVRYACAGHPGPVLVRPNGEASIIDDGSAPIGLMDDTAFDDLTIELAPGDRLFIHSDGLNEQRDPDGAEYGRSRLKDALADRGRTLADTIDAAVDRVSEWADGTELGDDCSLMGVEVRS